MKNTPSRQPIQNSQPERGVPLLSVCSQAPGESFFEALSTATVHLPVNQQWEGQSSQQAVLGQRVRLDPHPTP